jgi:hypothetical protein
MRRKAFERVGAGLAVLALWACGPALAQESESALAKHSRHPPTRIIVRPLVQSYPGPDAVRQCAFWLATEYRESGTVIVPRQHCWWERG